jgi:hypothetical protein
VTQKSVELLIGKLVTDESLRHRFNENPLATIEELKVLGLEFTTVELEAIRSIKPGPCEMLARPLDPRIKKLPMGSGGRKARP